MHLFHSLLIPLGGLVQLALVAAVPAPAPAGPTTSMPITTSTCSPRTICVDAVNPCGVKYGGCYNVCNSSEKPRAPPCTPTPAPTASVDTLMPENTGTPVLRCNQKPSPPTHSTTTTTTTTIPPYSTESDDCSTRTVCIDYINDCGMWYGGCVPDCKPWPTFTAPPCPSTSSSTVETLWPLSSYI